MWVIYGLVLAGGKGSRLYPLSRAQNPKQFLKSINNMSFLVNTVNRILPLVNKENVYVVTNRNYEDKIKEELKDIKKENIFAEPSNKETATCIGLSAIKLLKKDADAVMVLKVDPGSYVSVIALFLQTAWRLFVFSAWSVVSQIPFNSSVYAEYGSFKL
mgnify:CR=1 FL=1